jgi:hypothetical protein
VETYQDPKNFPYPDHLIESLHGANYDGRSKSKAVLTSVEMLKDYQGEKLKIGSS